MEGVISDIPEKEIIGTSLTKQVVIIKEKYGQTDELYPFDIYFDQWIDPFLKYFSINDLVFIRYDIVSQKSKYEKGKFFLKMVIRDIKKIN